MFSKKAPKGTTLIELVIAIIVAGVMMGGMMSAYSTVISRSADPMLTQQSLLVAKSLMEEILLKPYLDPTTQSTCPAPDPDGRPSFNNVCDYNGYVSAGGITDHQGNSLAGLTQYSVSVTVAPATGANALGSIDVDRALKIQVTVTNPLARPVTLAAWRACYESTVCTSL